MNLSRYYDHSNKKAPIEIGVNLDFEKESHETFAQNVLWLFLKLKEPTSHAQCSDAEHETILVLIDDFSEVLQEKLKATFAGYRVVEGWCELYFYAFSAKKFENIAAAVIASKYHYHYDIGSYKDSKFEFYYETLCPDGAQELQIKNSEIIEALKEAGDTLESARAVEHYFFFPTHSNAQRALDKILDLKFTCKDEFVDNDNAMRYGIIALQSHSVTPEVIEKTTAQFSELAKKEHGVYKGWSTTLA